MSASSCGAIHAACLSAVSRSSAELIRSSQGYGICVVLVAAFAIFTSAYCFSKWRQVSTYLWKYYGRYTAIMCAACCCTFFKVTSLIKATEYVSAVPGFHALNLTTSDAMFSALELHQHWYSSFTFFCAFEFTFMSLAELLVLHRYLDLAFKGLDRNESQNNVIRRYAVAGCFVILFAMSSIVCATLGIVYRLENNLRSSNWKNSNAKADYANAAQMFSEVVALLIKAFLFMFISRMDLERLEKIERWTFTNLVPSVSTINPKEVKAIGRKIIIVTCYIMFTLVVRLSFHTFEASSSFYDISQPNAPTAVAMLKCPLCDCSCSSEATTTATFLLFMPELYITNNLISVPLALMIGLWGMTSRSDLKQLLKSESALQTVRSIDISRSLFGERSSGIYG